MGRPKKYTVQQRLDKLFALKKVATGDVIKRHRHPLLTYIPIADLEAEVKKRHFHLAIVGDYVLIMCFPGPISLLA